MFQWLQAPKIILSDAQRTILEALQRERMWLNIFCSVARSCS